jgi:hypothetical protein
MGKKKCASLRAVRELPPGRLRLSKVPVVAPILLSGILVAWASAGSPKQENAITIAARASKTVYGPNEPVPIVIGISNHGTAPVYTTQNESDFLCSGCYVYDANGKEVPLPRDYRIQRPPPPPPSHYMQRDGKTVVVQPVYEIRGHGEMVAIMEDVMSVYHGHLPDGTYSLGFDEVLIVEDANALIVREGVGPRLWVESQLNMPIARRYPVNRVAIEIRSKPAEQGVSEKSIVEPNHPSGPAQPIAQATSHGWLCFACGLAAGVVGLWFVFSLRRKGTHGVGH